MRIHITGNAGSGKTTLAARIGVELGLPVYGLDSIVWSPGWRQTPPQERVSRVDSLISQPEWVIDGVSSAVRRASDVTILLDVSRLTSYGRCARRNWRYLFRSRPGLPDGCPEILIVPRLCQIIWRFPSNVLPQLLDDVNSRDARFFHVRNTEECQAALQYLGIEERTTPG